MSPVLARSIGRGKDELTAEEAEEFVAEQIRHYFGMSVDEFRRRAADGTLPPHPMVVHLALLSGVTVASC